MIGTSDDLQKGELAAGKLGKLLAHFQSPKERILDEEHILNLKEGRFLLALLRQFKRGKSTSANVLLGEYVTPIGHVLVTSAIVCVEYGEASKGIVGFRDCNTKEITQGEVTRTQKATGLSLEEDQSSHSFCHPYNDVHVAQRSLEEVSLEPERLKAEVEPLRSQHARVSARSAPIKLKRHSQYTARRTPSVELDVIKRESEHYRKAAGMQASKDEGTDRRDDEVVDKYLRREGYVLG